MAATKPLPSINLLQDRKRSQKKKQLLIAKVQTITGIVLAVFIGLSVLVGILRAGSSFQLSRVENQVERERDRLAQLKPVESLYTAVVSKFEHFETIDAERLYVPDLVDEVRTWLPEETILRQVEVSEAEDDGYMVQLTTESVHTAQALVTTIESLLREGEVEVIYVDNLGRDESGQYQVEALFAKELP